MVATEPCIQGKDSTEEQPRLPRGLTAVTARVSAGSSALKPNVIILIGEGNGCCDIGE